MDVANAQPLALKQTRGDMQQEQRQPPLTAAEEIQRLDDAIVRRGMTNFMQLGSAGMINFLCAATHDLDVGVVSPEAALYYYDRVYTVSEQNADEVERIAKTYALPRLYETVQGNIIFFIVDLFMAGTDYESALPQLFDDWLKQQPQGQAFTANQVVVGTLQLQDLPPALPGEAPFDYAQRNVYTIAPQVIFRQIGPDSGPWPQFYFNYALRDPLAPYNEDEPPSEDLFDYWWRLSPAFYFNVSTKANPLQESEEIVEQIDAQIATMRLGLLPLAATDPRLRTDRATWANYYNPRTQPWLKFGFVPGAPDPCGRYRAALGVLATTEAIVGPSQAVAVQSPIVSQATPEQLQPFLPSSAGLGAFAPSAQPALPLPPLALPSQGGTKRRAPITPEEEEEEEEREEDAQEQERVAQMPVGVPSPVIDAGEMATTCTACTKRLIPYDIIRVLNEDLRAWLTANPGVDIDEYATRVADQLALYEANPVSLGGITREQEEVGGERPTRRRRIEYEHEPSTQGGVLSEEEQEPGAGNVVRSILLDPTLRRAYGSQALLAYIQRWIDNPGTLYFNVDLGNREQFEASTLVICTECAQEQSNIYAERQREAPTANVGGLTVRYPFVPLPGISVVPEARTAVGTARLGPFTIVGQGVVQRIAPYVGPRPQAPLPPEAIVSLTEAMSNGYQIPWNWLTYNIGQYAIKPESLVVCRVEPQLYEESLGAGGTPIPLAIGRLIGYDTEHFDIVPGLPNALIGLFPTRALVQFLVSAATTQSFQTASNNVGGVPAGTALTTSTGPIESVRLDSIYPYAVGVDIPSIRDVLAVRGEAMQRLFAPTPQAATLLRTGSSLVNVRAAGGEGQGAPTLVDIYTALVEALQSPALAQSPEDYNRVALVYGLVRERVTELGINPDLSPSAPGITLTQQRFRQQQRLASRRALATVARITARESARQTPSSGVLRAAGRSSATPGPRASIEMLTGSAGGGPAEREQIEAIMADIEALQNEAKEVQLTVPAGPVSPTQPLALQLERPQPSDTMIRTQLGTEYPLVDNDTAWRTVLTTVTTKMRLNYPWLFRDNTTDTIAALIAVSLFGYGVAVPERYLTGQPVQGLRPPLDQLQSNVQVAPDDIRRQTESIAAIENWQLSGGNAPVPPPALSYNALIANAWNVIFNVPGYASPEQDAYMESQRGRRWWAYPGAPTTLASADGTTLDVFNGQPEIPLANIQYAVRLSLGQDVPGIRPNPAVQRLYQYIVSLYNRYQWQDVFTPYVGPTGLAVSNYPGAAVSVSVLPQVGIGRRSVQLGLPGARGYAVAQRVVLPTPGGRGTLNPAQLQEERNRSLERRQGLAPGTIAQSGTNPLSPRQQGRLLRQRQQVGAPVFQAPLPPAPAAAPPLAPLPQQQQLSPQDQQRITAQNAADARALSTALIFVVPQNVPVHGGQLRVITDPNLVRLLNSDPNNQVILDILQRTIDVGTQPAPGLTRADIVPINPTNSLVAHIRGSSSNVNQLWVRPTTVGVLRALGQAAPAGGAAPTSATPFGSRQ